MEGVTAAVESFIDKNIPARNNDFKEKSCRDMYLQYLKSKVKSRAMIPRQPSVPNLMSMIFGSIVYVLP